MSQVTILIAQEDPHISPRLVMIEISKSYYLSLLVVAVVCFIPNGTLSSKETTKDLLGG